MASLMLNLPGFISHLNIFFPLGTSLSFASKWPRGYVAKITKYEENEGALDLK